MTFNSWARLFPSELQEIEREQELAREREREKKMEEEKPLLSKKQERENGETKVSISMAEEEEGEEERTRLVLVKKEGRRVMVIAAPMIGVLFLQSIMQVITLIMAGHLGELSLSSSALAISLANVTGFSFLLGLSSGLETLCGQAYGAGQYEKVGTLTYTGMFTLTLVCIPLSAVWVYMGEILVFLGQDSIIAFEAGKFAVHLVPALFGYAMIQPLYRYYLSQGMTMPMLAASFCATCLNIPICWVLVFRTPLANLGAAVAIDVTMWLNVIFLLMYMRFSSVCNKTRPSSISINLFIDVFRGVWMFLRFALPSAAMTCLEWWAFEILILLSGLMPDPELENSVLSICLTTISTLGAVPFSFGAAGSIRVANELGGGNPKAARTALYTVMVIAVTEGIIVSSTLFALRSVFGYIFSNDTKVVSYVDQMSPMICLNIMMDCLNFPLSGVARGVGWQHAGAIINLAAFYLIGIPTGIFLGFRLKLEGRGLWMGILCGSTLQISLLSILIIRTDWEKKGKEARQRIFDKHRRGSGSGALY